MSESAERADDGAVYPGRKTVTKWNALSVWLCLTSLANHDLSLSQINLISLCRWWQNSYNFALSWYCDHRIFIFPAHFGSVYFHSSTLTFLIWPIEWVRECVWVGCIGWFSACSGLIHCMCACGVAFEWRGAQAGGTHRVLIITIKMFMMEHK